MKKMYSLLALLLIASMLLTACGGGGDGKSPGFVEGGSEFHTPTEPPTEEPTEVAAPADAGVSACQVTDVGGIDDKTFNATAWKGAENAAAELGVEVKYLESQQQTDYQPNINAFIDEGCDLIITVGFLLGVDTEAAAQANPDQSFAIVDFAYDPGYDNVLGLVFGTDQAAFLTGYVAAATSETKVVGTFGGINIPPVTAFMNGFYYGVQYYNEQMGEDVQVLGWDPATQDGLFTGNFESTDDGRSFAETLMDEGADVIMPVAGPVGLGSAAAIQERGGAWIIGVDTDMSVSAPEYADIILTSVLKNMDVAVYAAIENMVNGTFAGGLYVGTLENNGVGIAGMDGFSADLQAALQAIIDGIIAGDIQTSP
ncbi:MAG: BMP family ABC transporter substrate-binding protein [Anaerolineae bacterium]|nr:BMP family ABC transporter substrate-binding protein [Anaerolineae bacterium]